MRDPDMEPRLPEFRATTDSRPKARPVTPELRSDPRPNQPRPNQPRPNQPRLDQPRSEPRPSRAVREAPEPRYRRGEREVHTLIRRRRVYALRRFLPPVLVFVLAMFLAFLWSSGATGTIFGSVKHFLLEQSVKAGFVVDNITVEGRDRLSEAELREAMGITKGTPIFAVDPEEARARVSSIGWVKSVAVARELPNSIKVVIEERKPAALWQHDGILTLIDADGHPITSTDLGVYGALLQVVGEGAEDAASALVPVLQTEPHLAAKVKAAVRVGERRWDIVFKSGVRARLPEKNVEQAWKRLAGLERQHNLLEREIHIVDLRQPDRLVLRLTEPEAERRKEERSAVKPKGARV